MSFSITSNAFVPMLLILCKISLTVFVLTPYHPPYLFVGAYNDLIFKIYIFKNLFILGCAGSLLLHKGLL